MIELSKASIYKVKLPLIMINHDIMGLNITVHNTLGLTVIQRLNARRQLGGDDNQLQQLRTQTQQQQTTDVELSWLNRMDNQKPMAGGDAHVATERVGRRARATERVGSVVAQLALALALAWFPV
ncbi:hypothetical protein ACFE04_016128 [Oxalis oulophora]